MSKITLDKDKYFIETKNLDYTRYDSIETPKLIPIKNITDVDAYDDFNWLPFVIIIEYCNRGSLKECCVPYKTKKERDKDWDKLKNLERIR